MSNGQNDDSYFARAPVVNISFVVHCRSDPIMSVGVRAIASVDPSATSSVRSYHRCWKKSAETDVSGCDRRVRRGTSSNHYFLCSFESQYHHSIRDVVFFFVIHVVNR